MCPPHFSQNLRHLCPPMTILKWVLFFFFPPDGHPGVNVFGRLRRNLAPFLVL